MSIFSVSGNEVRETKAADRALAKPRASVGARQRALELQARFGAIGIAVGCRDGEEIACVFSSGQGVPAEGARLNGRGVCADAFERNAPVLCRDAWNDARVDREACVALGIRSLVAVPAG